MQAKIKINLHYFFLYYQLTEVRTRTRLGQGEFTVYGRTGTMYIVQYSAISTSFRPPPYNP
jgi:hypothetical protein